MKSSHLLLLSGLILLTEATISTYAKCPKDCSGHGQCINGQQPACSCDAGFFLEDCSLDLKGNNFVIAAEVFYGLFYASILYLSAYVFFKNPTQTTTLTPITNLRKISFACVALVCLSQLAFLVDPLHAHGIFPNIAIQILYCIPYLMFLFIYIATLFHWVELINTSLHRMNKENMLQKINKSYQPKEVTVEEVIEQVKFLRKKLLIPFSIIVGFLFSVILAIAILIGFEIRTYAMRLALQTVVTVYWLGLFIGYVIYGQKLEELMPPLLFEKVNKLRKRIAMLSLFFLVLTLGIFLGFATVGRYDPLAFVVLCLAHEMFLVVSCMLTLAIYVHWESYFPSLFRLGYSTESRPGTVILSPQASDISITLPADIYPQLARTLSSMKIKRTGVDFTKSPTNSSSSFFGEDGSPTNGTTPPGRSRSNTPLQKSYLTAYRDPSDNDVNQVSMISIGISKSPDQTSPVADAEQTEAVTEADDLSETSSLDSEKTEPQTPPKQGVPFDWLAVGSGKKVEYPVALTKSFSLRDGVPPISPATIARRNTETAIQ